MEPQLIGLVSRQIFSSGWPRHSRIFLYHCRKIRTARNRCGRKIHDFRPLSLHTSETVQDTMMLQSTNMCSNCWINARMPTGCQALEMKTFSCGREMCHFHQTRTIRVCKSFEMRFSKLYTSIDKISTDSASALRRAMMHSSAATAADWLSYMHLFRSIIATTSIYYRRWKVTFSKRFKHLQIECHFLDDLSYIQSYFI